MKKEGFDGLREFWLELALSSAAMGFMAWTFIEAEIVVGYLNKRLFFDTGFTLTPTPYRILAILLSAYIVLIMLGIFLRRTLIRFEGREVIRHYGEELMRISEKIEGAYINLGAAIFFILFIYVPVATLLKEVMGEGMFICLTTFFLSIIGFFALIAIFIFLTKRCLAYTILFFKLVRRG